MTKGAAAGEGTGLPGPALVTIDNWRERPWSLYAFDHVETLIPVAPVPAGPAPSALPDAGAGELPDLAFADPDGRERRFSEVMAMGAMRGLAVLRGGRLVAERYALGHAPERPHILFSVTKSVTGLLAGILAGRGLLDPEAPVTDYVPEVADSAYGDARVRHLLDMTAAVNFDESYGEREGDYGRYRRSTLWNRPRAGEEALTLHRFLATLPRGAGPHGAVFSYISPNSDLLGWVLERAGGAPYAELLSQLLWAPMGAEAAALVTVDRAGSARAAGGLAARVRDLARLGELVRLGGRGVVPADWIADLARGGDRNAWRRGSFAGLFPAGTYRSQWYATGLPSGALAAIGIHGQWLWVDPAREVVIAKLGAQAEPVDEPLDALTIAAFDALAAALAAREV